MIERYQTKDVAAIWDEKEKYSLWLRIELAVIDAKAKFGFITAEQAKRIREMAKFDLDRIFAIEAVTDHDLEAFVEAVRENLLPEDRGVFHAGMTSYDTEEIPTSLRLKASIIIVYSALKELGEIILHQAKEHKMTLMIGRTHGQQAEPITFGFKLLGWLDIFQRDCDRLEDVQGEISVGKISGAVGVYGLDPRIETAVCEQLDLKPALHSTQILHRDRIARALTTLAILAGNIEHVAQDFRLMAQTEIGEVREPFGKGQKGSSRMPHKKNTITTERLCGLARTVRANALVSLENIATWGERDISQSGPERIILPDTFHLIHYMIQKLTWVLDKMEVFPANMRRNLEFSQGAIYSGRVKDLLLSWGLDPETVYQLIQQNAFDAMARNVNFAELLKDQSIIQAQLTSSEHLAAFRHCFDPWTGLQYLDEIFTRFGL